MARMLICHALDDTDQANHAVLTQLCQKLRATGHEILLASGKTSQAAFLSFLHDELPSCHWFVLFQTPSAARSPLIRTAVARALDLVKQQRLGGILRFIAQDSDPQALPPAWSTIPAFDAGNDFLLDQDYLPLYLRTPLAAPSTPVLASVPPLAASAGPAPYPGGTSAMPGKDAPPLPFTGLQSAHPPSEEPLDPFSYTPSNRLSDAPRDPAETYTALTRSAPRLPRFLLIGGAIVAGIVLFSGLFLNLGLLRSANKHAAQISKPISTTTTLPFSPTPAATIAATPTTVPTARATTGAVAPTTTSAPTPYPGALRNHPFAKAWSPTDLYNWGPGSNAPGNCYNPNTSEIVNHVSYVQLSTSGTTGDCVDLESPLEYPTADGYVYEAQITVSNWTQWLAFWMYGSNWPVAGEIDGIEGGSGRNFVSYHYEGANGPTEVSNCNDTNGCDGTAGPITQPSNSATLANISPGTHIIDILFGRCGSGCGAIGVWYDGTEVALVSGTNVLDGGSTNDPYWITFSTGSCNSASNGNICDSQGQTGGNIQIAYLREFT